MEVIIALLLQRDSSLDYYQGMLDLRNNRELLFLRERIISDPSGDYDDALFHAFLTASAIGKEIAVTGRVLADNGLRYAETSLTAAGMWEPLRAFLYSFTDSRAALDGFVLDGIIIEKDFIEEIVSGLDDSGVSAVIGDVLGVEAEAAVVPSSDDEAVRLSEDAMHDLIIDLPVQAATGDDDDRKRLAAAFFSLFSIIQEKGIHTAAIPLFPGYDAALFADIALSSVSAFLCKEPDYFIQIVFVLPDEDAMNAFVEGNAEA